MAVLLMLVSDLDSMFDGHTDHFLGVNGADGGQHFEVVINIDLSSAITGPSPLYTPWQSTKGRHVHRPTFLEYRKNDRPGACPCNSILAVLTGVSPSPFRNRAGGGLDEAEAARLNFSSHRLV